MAVLPRWRARCIQARSIPATLAARLKARRGPPSSPKTNPSSRSASEARISPARTDSGERRVFRAFVSPRPCADTTHANRSAR